MVVLLIFVTYLAILVYFLGKSIVWASGWGQNTAMILTIVYGLLVGGAIILMSLFVLLSAQLIGSIGSIKSPGVEITSKQAKSVKKGARLAVVTKRFGKPLSQ